MNPHHNNNHLHNGHGNPHAHPFGHHQVTAGVPSQTPTAPIAAISTPLAQEQVSPSTTLVPITAPVPTVVATQTVTIPATAQLFNVQLHQPTAVPPPVPVYMNMNMNMNTTCIPPTAFAPAPHPNAIAAANAAAVAAANAASHHARLTVDNVASNVNHTEQQQQQQEMQSKTSANTARNINKLRSKKVARKKNKHKPTTLFYTNSIAAIMSNNDHNRQITTAATSSSSGAKRPSSASSISSKSIQQNSKSGSSNNNEEEEEEEEGGNDLFKRKMRRKLLTKSYQSYQKHLEQSQLRMQLEQQEKKQEQQPQQQLLQHQQQQLQQQRHHQHLLQQRQLQQRQFQQQQQLRLSHLAQLQLELQLHQHQQQQQRHKISKTTTKEEPLDPTHTAAKNNAANDEIDSTNYVPINAVTNTTKQNNNNKTSTQNINHHQQSNSTSSSIPSKTEKLPIKYEKFSIAISNDINEIVSKATSMVTAELNTGAWQIHSSDSDAGRTRHYINDDDNNTNNVEEKQHDQKNNIDDNNNNNNINTSKNDNPVKINFASISKILSLAASLEQFATNIIVPNMQASGVGEVECLSDNPHDVSTFRKERDDKVFIATLLSLREILILNAKLFFSIDIACNDDEGEKEEEESKKQRENGKQFQAIIIATSLIQSAIQRIEPETERNSLLDQFKSAACQYDTGHVDFASCFKRVDACSLGVTPNGRVLGREENIAWRTSFNKCRERHPIVEMMMEKEGAMVGEGEKRKKKKQQLFVPPSPNACFVSVVENVDLSSFDQGLLQGRFKVEDETYVLEKYRAFMRKYKREISK